MKPLDIKEFNGTRLDLALRFRMDTNWNLAKKLGVTASTVSNYRRQRTMPTMKSVEIMADHLNFPISFFSKTTQNIHRE